MFERRRVGGLEHGPTGKRFDHRQVRRALLVPAGQQSVNRTHATPRCNHEPCPALARMHGAGSRSRGAATALRTAARRTRDLRRDPLRPRAPALRLETDAGRRRSLSAPTPRSPTSCSNTSRTPTRLSSTRCLRNDESAESNGRGLGSRVGASPSGWPSWPGSSTRTATRPITRASTMPPGWSPNINCAIFGVAMRYGQACSSEIEFIRAIMPDRDRTHVTHGRRGAPLQLPHVTAN